MKKQLTVMLLFVLILSGCVSGRMGNPGAIVAGASIGGSLGSSIGGLVGDRNRGWRGGYHGSAIGNIVGTIAGAAIGSALTAPKQEPIEDNAYIPEVHEIRIPKYKQSSQQVRQSFTQLKLRRIRFIDDNRNHVIDAGENSKIIFEIMNEGRNPVYNVVPVVETVGKVKHIGISPSVMIEEILSGEGIRYTASIHVGERLRDGEITFRVAVADENGVICDSQEFTLLSAKIIN
ncbi:glycine zipper family protein [uncultured Bacteroides sp.]|uniref:glycine zipper family protein n=1 Tax=uncultured Bacteroides sp. TaxID=162156 RepID=UPI0025FF0887|nr:glycine zipper family protein [uncultured Bacteroides sp.]